MKKFLLLLAGIVLAGNLAYADAITVSKPAAGEEWCTGKAYSIKWSWQSLNSGKKVRIVLFNPATSQNVMEIAVNEPDDGDYLWSIPATVTDGNYKIKIKIVGEETIGLSQQFKVKKCSSLSGAIKTIDKGKLVAKENAHPVLLTLEVTSPAAENHWDGGTTKTIRWESNIKKPMKVELYNYNGSTFVAKIAENLSSYPSDGKWSYNWTIPTDIGPAACKVRVSTMDNSREAFSPKFYVRQELKQNVFTIAAVTTNKYRYRSRKESGSFSMAPKIWDDPGSGKARVGYNSEHGDTYDNAVIYRSHLAFNVTSCKGKGLLLKAKLKYHQFMGNAINIKVYVLDQAWNGESDALFAVPASLANADNLTSFIQGWINNPESNFGIVLVGPNESLDYGLGEYVGYFDDIKLELEFLSTDK